MKYIRRYFGLIISTDLIAPLCLIIFYIIFIIFLRNVLPSSQEIIVHAQALYARYGYELIFFGAVAEGLILINLLAPGSLTIGLGAVFARAGVLNLPTAILVAFLGAMIAYIIDYALGYFGFSKMLNRFGLEKVLKSTNTKLEKNPVQAFSLSFIHPNIGCMVSLAAGVAKMKFWRFLILSAAATIAWCIFWGILIYALGDIFLKIVTKYLITIIVFGIIIWILSMVYNKRKAQNSKLKF